MGGRAAAILAGGGGGKSRAASILGASEPSAEEFMADVDSKEAKFRDWYSGVSSKLGLSSDPDEKEHYYDYRGFYDALQRGEVSSPDQPGGHWDSKFKADDHPRRYLLDPETGRFFDSHSGTYTGGEHEPVPGDRMDRINATDTPDLSKEDWAAAAGGANRSPSDHSPRALLDQLLNGRAQQSYGDIERGVAKSGVDYEQPRAADAYMGLMSPLGAAGKGLGGVAKSAANETIMGAATAALEGFQSGVPPEQVLRDLLQAGGISGAADVALAGVGKAGSAAGDLLKTLGGKARNVVAGGTKKEAEGILERFGQPEAIDEMLGGLLEKHSQSPWYGRSSAGYLKDIKSKLPAAQGEHSAALAQGAAEGVNDYIPAAWANVQGRAAEEAASRGARAVGSQKTEAAAFQSLADDLSGLEAPSSVQDFVRDKSGLQAAGSGTGAYGISDKAIASADAFGGRVMRDELDHGVMAAAEPETYESFLASRDKVRDLSTLEELLSSKVAGEQSGGDFGNAIGGAIAGSVLGTGASMLTPGDDTNVLGGTGLIGGLAYGTRSGLRQAMGSWGSDVGANLLKGGGKAAAGIGNALDRAPVGALTGQGIADNSDSTRGHEAVKTIEQALATNPQQLGPYAERLANAENKQVEVMVLWDEEPEFRQLMRQLQGGR